MNGVPAVQRLGRAVLLQESAVSDVAYLVGLGLRTVASRDGVQPMRRWVLLQRFIQQTADLATDEVTGGGNIPLPQPAELPALQPEELVSTREAAAMLALTERQTRNLATRLGARHVGRALLFDLRAVEAEARHRQSGDR